MNRQRNEIKSSALNLTIGENLRTQCPFCLKNDKGFSISRIEEGILYNCYHNSCNAKGFIPSFPSELVKSPHKPAHLKLFLRPLTLLPPEVVLFLTEQYGFTKEIIEQNHIKYDVNYHRTYIPILNKDGYEIGASCKVLPPMEIDGVLRESGGPKVLNYWFNEDVVKLHIHPSCQKRSLDYVSYVVLVEDSISAIKVGEVMPSIALLGTHLNEPMVGEIREISDRIIIALDNDAIDKAIKYAHRYRLYFKDIQVAMLTKDPKVMSYEEIKREIWELSSQ